MSKKNIFLESNQSDGNYSALSTPSSFHRFADKIRTNDNKVNLTGGKSRSGRGKNNRSMRSNFDDDSDSDTSETSSTSENMQQRNYNDYSDYDLSRSNMTGGRINSRSISSDEDPIPDMAFPHKKTGKRQLNPAMKEFQKLSKHIVNTMGIKGGPVAFKLASIYKKKALKQSPNLDSVEAMKKAKEIFDDDSVEDRKRNLKEAEKEIEQKKSQKKLKKKNNDSEVFSDTS